ncbi:hypothetical protein D1007_27968 [Hordeum vulgare]|nr:hypothetical protein D1007_27968 [Hordeum vulgare]
MLPLSQSSSSFRGVRARPSDVFYAEIRSGTFASGSALLTPAKAAARTYDAAAWRLSRPPPQWNAAALAQCDLRKALTWSDNDDCWDDAFLTPDYATEESDGE